MTDNLCKKCRREGEKLFLKGDRCFSQKCAMTKKPYAPGAHGLTGRGRISEYGQQLREKQKVKRIYGVKERQFSNYYKKAAKNKEGITGEELLRFLEKRLDNVIYRLGFATSRNKARQMVSHGHIKINGKKVSIASYIVTSGEIISLSDKFSKKEEFKKIQDSAKGNKDVPDWLKVDSSKMEAEIVKNPERDNIDSQINENLIVEFYSR